MKNKKYISFQDDDGEFELEVRVSKKEEERLEALGVTCITLQRYYLPPFNLNLFFIYICFLIQDLINFKFFNHSFRSYVSLLTYSQVKGNTLNEKQKLKLQKLEKKFE